jgi:hypothetical protein
MNNTLENEPLEIFLRRKSKENDEKRKAIDWEARKQQWLAWLDKLYEEINEWLNPLKREGIVNLNYENTSLLEDYIRPYSVKNLIISVGGECITLKPKGMVLVNSWGRVDMMGNDGSVMLILIEKDDDANDEAKIQTTAKLQWHIAVRTPHMKYWQLTKDSFTDALKQVMQK